MGGAWKTSGWAVSPPRVHHAGRKLETRQDPHPSRCARHPLPRCGRGAMTIQLKAPLPHRERGGTKPRRGLVGEGLPAASCDRFLGGREMVFSLRIAVVTASLLTLISGGP